MTIADVSTRYIATLLVRLRLLAVPRGPQPRRGGPSRGIGTLEPAPSTASRRHGPPPVPSAAMSSRPQPTGGPMPRPRGEVDYRLSRQRILKQYEGGRLGRMDVCD